jgi:hypothetical protein
MDGDQALGKKRRWPTALDTDTSFTHHQVPVGIGPEYHHCVGAAYDPIWEPYIEACFCRGGSDNEDLMAIFGQCPGQEV